VGVYLQTLKTEVVYRGRVVSLLKNTVSLPTGQITIREKITHPGSVGILPMLENGNLILVKQFRYVIGSYLLEIPAGTIEEGESPEECAARELLEETGYHAGKLNLITSFYLAPGYSDEFMWLFEATDLSCGEMKPMADESIEVKEVSLKEALNLIKSGVIKDAKTICAILLSTASKQSDVR